MTKKIDRVIKECAHCKKEFLARCLKHRPGKFCSQDCQRKGRYIKPEIKVYGKCETCAKEFSQPKHWKSLAKYCSIPCMAVGRGKGMRREKHKNWKGGSARTGTEKFILAIRKEIGKCERCGSKDRLNVHHKIKVSERPDLAMDRENIEVNCEGCHAKEHPEFKGMILKVKSGIHKNCAICDKEYYIPQYKIPTSKYCSRECSLKITSVVFRR